MTVARRTCAGLGVLGMLGCSTGPVEATRSVASPSAVAPVPRATAADPLPFGAIVVEDDKLDRLLAVARPRCILSQRFFESNGAVVSSYRAYAPSLAQAALDEAFVAEAARASLAVTERPLLGRGVFLDADARAAWIQDAAVTVLVPAAKTWKADVERRARAAKLDTWKLVESFGDGARWQDVEIEQSDDDRGTFIFTLADARTPIPVIESWARGVGATRDKADWIRGYDAGSKRSGLDVELAADGRVHVFEATGGGPSGPACAPHPSRKSAPPARGPSPSNPSPTDKAEEERLLREMMGKP